MDSNMILEIIITALLASGLSALILYVYYTGKMKSWNDKYVLLYTQKLDLDHHFAEEQKTRVAAQDKAVAVELENIGLRKDIESLNYQIANLEQNEERQQKQFEYLAQKILSKSSERVSALHQKDLQSILGPLSNEIKQYREKVEQNTLESAKGHASLKETVIHLAKNTEVVSEQANQLVQTLKMDHKKQGIWGEVVLESILDKSGLMKNREYHVQNSERDQQGSVKRPDVVLDLPDGKKLIIDAKVSLRSFEKLISAGDPEEANQHRKEHLKAIKNHINRLAEKNYHELYQIECPDFVFMFIPLDNAYASALNQDPSLHDYAYKRNVIVTTSSTLLTVLKTAESLWRIDKQNKNALAIADEAGKMYDKFMNVLADLDKLGSQMKTASNTYENAMTKFVHGHGNLVKRAEKIKGLGAKANKVVPKGLLQKVV